MKVTVNNLNFNVSERSISDQDQMMLEFWKQCGQNWESRTYALFDKFLDKDHIYLDIGAWIGPTVLYGGQLAKECYGFEPDKMALEYLINNIKENPEFSDKIKIYNFGIGNTNKQEKFYVGNGSTSMASTKPNHINVNSYYDVQIHTPETAIAKAQINFTEVNFIKIDIEGGEYDLIPTLLSYCKKVNHFPILYISLHAPFLFSPFWKKSIVHKLMAYLPKKIIARLKNIKTINSLREFYQYIYLPDGTPLTKLSQLGDARAFQEIVVSNKPW